MNAKTTTCLAVALALALAPAAAADDQPQEDFRALEERLLQALVDGDAEAINALISPQFGYYQAAHDRPIHGLSAERWRQAALDLVRLESFEIHESHARPIGDQVMLTATRATLNRSGPMAGGRQRLLTSTWLQDAGGAWKLVARIDVELAGDGGAGRQPARARMSDEDRETLRKMMRERMGEGEDREAAIKSLREKWADEEGRKEMIEAFRARRAAGRQGDDEAAGEEADADEPPGG